MLKWPVLKAQAIFLCLISIVPVRSQTDHALGTVPEVSIGGLGVVSFGLGRFIMKEKPLDTLFMYDRSGLPGIDRIALDRWSVPAHTTSDVVMSTSVVVSLVVPLIVQQGHEPMVPVTIILESLLLTSGVTSMA